MDTDYLTPMAYNIVFKADEILDVLKSEIGDSCIHYDTEDSFLEGVLVYMETIIDDSESYLDYWNCLDEVDVVEFRRNLRNLKNGILEVINTPLDKRGDPPFK